jgi:hypothetical protein
MAHSGNHFTFTQVTVERVRPPKAGRVIYWDALTPGFGIRISAPRRGRDAHKAWINLYRDADRNQVFETLGTYAQIPKLAAARARARDRRRAALDPQQQLPEARNRSSAHEAQSQSSVDEAQGSDIEFTVTFEDYLTDCAQRKGKRKPNKPSTLREKRRILNII